jgi:hypothetical protein
LITLNEKYQITADKDCYTARYMTGGKPKLDKKTGKVEEASQTVGFYGTLEAAVSGCRNDAIRRKAMEYDMTLAEAVEEMKRINAEFEKAIKGK